MHDHLRQSLTEWTTQQGLEIVREKDGHSFVCRYLPGRGENDAGVPHPHQEIGVVLVSRATLLSGIAQARVNLLIPWRERRRDRSIVAVVPRDVTQIELQPIFRDIDLLVLSPVTKYYPSNAGKA